MYNFSHFCDFDISGGFLVVYVSFSELCFSQLGVLCHSLSLGLVLWTLVCMSSISNFNRFLPIYLFVIFREILLELCY